MGVLGSPRNEGSPRESSPRNYEGSPRNYEGSPRIDKDYEKLLSLLGFPGFFTRMFIRIFATIFEDFDWILMLT